MTDNSIGIKIDGGSNMKEAAEPLADAIVKILEANAEQETIRKALDVFGRSVSIQNVNLSDMTVHGPKIYNLVPEAE